jgi:uncharacterized membrane protein
MNVVRLYAILASLGLALSATAEENTVGQGERTDPHAPSGGVPSYAFTTLTVSGAENTDVWDINNRGTIVGHYIASGVTHGFVARLRGTYDTIDFPGAVFTQATAINDRGDIAGTYRLPNDSVLHAYLMQADGNFTNMDVPGATSSLPRDLSKHGDVAFEAVVGGHTTAYLLTGGEYLNIEPSALFAGGPVTFSYASGLNPQGALVGRYDTATTGARGYLLDPAGPSPGDEAYTTLHFPNAASSAALGINKRGVIVGGYTKDGVRHGYVLIDGVYTSLDVPGCSSTVAGGAMTCTTPRKVNDGGHVVGFYGAGGTTVKGFVARPIGVKDLVLVEGDQP